MSKTNIPTTTCSALKRVTGHYQGENGHSGVPDSGVQCNLGKKGKEPMGFNPIDVYVGGRVKMRRKTAGLTQQDLAKALGLTFQQVQKYERGANRISASKLFMIANTLDVAISWFFDGVENEDIEIVNGFSEEAGGFSPGAVQDVLKFASSNEGIELNRAFSNVNDTRTRKFLVGLFEAIADTPDQSP